MHHKSAFLYTYIYIWLGAAFSTYLPASLSLQHARPCEALSTAVCVVHENRCTGQGAQRGRGFTPSDARCQCQSRERAS